MDTGLSSVRLRVAAAAARSGRSPASVVVVAVSKSASDGAVLAAHEAGVRDFGENRAHDLTDRVPRLPGDIRWHFVGRLQTNKVPRVRPVVHLLHSLDRLELASSWVRGGGVSPPALVQVNVSGEPQKAGIFPGDAAPLIDAALGMGIDVRGLMTIPPLATSGEAARPHFAALRELRDRLRGEFPTLTELSMGMTDDFEVAVEEGATILRVGRAIFRVSPEEG